MEVREEVDKMLSGTGMAVSPGPELGHPFLCICMGSRTSKKDVPRC